MKKLLTILSFFVVLRTYAQTPVGLVDSLSNNSLHALDSVLNQASNLYKELKFQYDSTQQNYLSFASALQAKADSLSKVKLPFAHLVQIKDSIDSVSAAKLSSIKNELKTVKLNTKANIEGLNLPSELKSKVEEYSKAVDKFDLSVPTMNVQFPSVEFNNNLQLPLPDLKTPTTESLANLSMNNIPLSNEISSTRSRLQGLNQSVPNDIPSVDQLGKMAETQATQIDDIKAVQDQMDNLPTAALTEEQAKQELLIQGTEAVTDHFSGKEQELKSAMGEISKYKKKFHNVNNLEELAALIKKRPNEMRGKPLIERIVPGIAFQIQKKDDLLFVDFNPYIGYRFTGRLTAGMGWSERVSYNLNDNLFESESRIYGPRAFGEFKLWRGFSPRLEVESMNTFVPPYIKASPADVGQRQWVWGVFAGIKKDYKFFKKINGTALVMFRLFDPHRKSPYADVVNARFGFEFPMKKKVKTPK